MVAIWKWEVRYPLPNSSIFLLLLVSLLHCNIIVAQSSTYDVASCTEPEGCTNTIQYYDEKKKCKNWECLDDTFLNHFDNSFRLVTIIEKQAVMVPMNIYTVGQAMNLSCWSYEKESSKTEEVPTVKIENAQSKFKPSSTFYFRSYFSKDVGDHSGKKTKVVIKGIVISFKMAADLHKVVVDCKLVLGETASTYSTQLYAFEKGEISIKGPPKVPLAKNPKFVCELTATADMKSDVDFVFSLDPPTPLDQYKTEYSVEKSGKKFNFKCTLTFLVLKKLNKKFFVQCSIKNFVLQNIGGPVYENSKTHKVDVSFDPIILDPTFNIVGVSSGIAGILLGLCFLFLYLRKRKEQAQAAASAGGAQGTSAPPPPSAQPNESILKGKEPSQAPVEGAPAAGP